MERISILLQKIAAIAENESKNTTIDIDLMLDYTRVLYADLLEMRGKIAFNAPPAQEREPVFAKAMKEDKEKHNEEPHVEIVTPPIIAPSPASIPVSTAGNIPSGNKRDIRNLIGINDKYLFISELFGNNNETYEHVLNEINGAWDEQNAIDLLQEHVYGTYGWDKENETTELFYNLLNKFFSTI
ncbi:MAG: hypothetical protein JSS96_11360 [Bacteroidetes bacterium]|nr:hypothetical protein [Bacteroidota bacterium]